MKVSLVARAATASLAPWDDDGEIWTLSFCKTPRVTRYFDIHHPDRPGRMEKIMHPPVVDRINQSGVPFYMYEAMPEVFPNSVTYPYEEVSRSVTPYLESSMAYMLALAIHEGFDEIGLYGMQVAMWDEYRYQRPNLEYLIGLAQGRGIKCEPCPGSLLMTSVWTDGRYGLCGERRFNL